MSANGLGSSQTLGRISGTLNLTVPGTVRLSVPADQETLTGEPAYDPPPSDGNRPTVGVMPRSWM